MSTRARVEYDPMMAGVRIAVRREQTLLTWQPHGLAPVTERGTEPMPEAWLRLDEDDARAMYEALADYFGGAGHDTRALRRDYDAERARVDRLIGLATERGQS